QWPAEEGFEPTSGLLFHAPFRGQRSRVPQPNRPAGACGQAHSVGTEGHGADQTLVSKGAEFLAAGQVPHLHRPVIAARSHTGPVGTEGHILYLTPVALERAEFLAAGQVPHLHRPVIAARSHTGPVGTEGHTTDLILMSLERAEPLAAGYVPQLDRPAITASQPRPVGAESHAPNHAGSWKGAEFLAGGHVPQLDRLMMTARSQKLPVGTEGQRIDLFLASHLMAGSAQGVEFFAAGHVPQSDTPVMAA